MNKAMLIEIEAIQRRIRAGEEYFGVHGDEILGYARHWLESADEAARKQQALEHAGETAASAESCAAKTSESEDDDSESTEPEHLDQMGLVVLLMRHLVKCGYKHLETRQMNAIIRAADGLMAEMREPHKAAPPACGIDKWLASDETGQSSLHMAQVMWVASHDEDIHAIPNIEKYPLWPKHAPHRAAKPYPLDPSDLNRCRKLLLAVPSLKEYLHAMLVEGQVWKAYIEHWDELIALLESEITTTDEGGDRVDKVNWSAPKTYDRMQELRRDAEKPAAEQPA